MKDTRRKAKTNLTRRLFVRGSIFTLASMISTERWAFGVEPRWFEVERIEMPLPRLEKAFNGYKLVQISDLHLGDGLNQAQLDDVVQKVNALNADLVAITGDFISSHAELQEKKLAHSLGKLTARDGVVAVMGNHDHWSNVGSVRRALRAAGVRELPNQVYTVRRGQERLYVVGADCPGENKHNIAPAVQRMPQRGAAILLAHEPDFADEFSRYERFDLQLSGHSHAGQVCLPFSGPIILPQHGKKYPRGQYQVGSMKLYTNRGVGSSGIPVRFFCRPEISLFTLRTTQRQT